MVQADNEATEVISIRLPVDLAQFIDEQSAALRNSRAEIVRFALLQYRMAVAAGVAASAALSSSAGASQPEPEGMKA